MNEIKYEKEREQLLIIISTSHMITLHNKSFSVTTFSFPFQKIHFLQKLLFMELELPHGYLICRVSKHEREEKSQKIMHLVRHSNRLTEGIWSQFLKWKSEKITNVMDLEASYL